MKPHAKGLIISLVMLALLALSVTAQAADDSRLRLTVTNSTLTVDEEVTVEVQIENAPEIYGADIALTFDPTKLEVVDADQNRDGVQFQQGDFLDTSQAFILQHKADNEAGTIDYALTLLNPAPPARGDGLLAQITFRAKADGQTMIHIEDRLLSTLDGERIIPTVEEAEINIASNILEKILRNTPLADPDSGWPLGATLLLIALTSGTLLVVRRRRLARTQRA